MLLTKDKISNAFNIDSSRVSEEGYLYLRARIARTGIQEYHASEVGKIGDAVYKIYRPKEEVMDALSLASFVNKPVTDNHPSELVGVKNYKSLAVGFSGDSVIEDGEYVVATLMITDETAIEKIKAGKIEISNGYNLKLDWTAGVTPTGENYDAIQRKIRGNHIALVDAGRCGSECSLQTDCVKPSAAKCNCNKIEKVKPMAELITVNLDGIGLVTDQQKVDAINKLVAEKATLSADLKTMNDAKTIAEAEAAVFKATIAARDKTITDLKAAQKDSSLIDEAIAEKEAAISGATKILGKAFDGKGKSAAQIKAEVVLLKIPNTAKDKSADYFAAAFDALASQAKPSDKLADAMRGGVQSPTGGAADKYKELNVNKKGALQ